MHLDLVVWVHLASFSSDALLEQLLQTNPLSRRRTSACGLEFPEVHSTDQEVAEYFLAAAGRRGFARGPLPTAVAEVACIVLFPAMASLLANRCILADCEALQGHQVVEQAVQHCFHQLSRNRAQWASDSLNQNLDGWNAEQ